MAFLGLLPRAVTFSFLSSSAPVPHFQPLLFLSHFTTANSSQLLCSCLHPSSLRGDPPPRPRSGQCLSQPPFWARSAFQGQTCASKITAAAPSRPIQAAKTDSQGKGTDSPLPGGDPRNSSPSCLHSCVRRGKLGWDGAERMGGSVRSEVL